MEKIESLNIRLEAIQQEINNLEYEKREKSLFITLETLQIKKVEKNNLKDEFLKIKVDKLDKIAREELYSKINEYLNDLEESITKTETEKKKFKKISNKQLYILKILIF
jgi:hypothetical protein